MVYLAVAVVFFLVFGFITFLDEKRKDQHREINSLYEFISRQNDRLSSMQTAIAAVEHQVRELTTQVKITDQQEKRVLEGMNNILNYDMGQALKAVKHYAEDESDE